MGEVLIKFTEPVRSASGRDYQAQACCNLAPGELWEGWIEFQPLDGGEPLRGARETQQPTHADVEYWATGLTMTYLEGALQRALAEKFGATAPSAASERSRFDAPVARMASREGSTMRAVLDPFAVYSQGEDVLRRQLRALSRDQIENVVEAFGIRDEVARNPLTVTSDIALADEVVAVIRRHRDRSVTRPSSFSSRDANPSR